MNSRISTAKRTSLLAAGLVWLAAAAMSPAAAQNAAPAAAPGAPPAGWFKACSKQQDVDICNVQNIMVSENGQLVTGISLIEIKGKVNRRAFQVSVPTGRLVPPGIGMQVDGGQATKLDYMICLPDRCIAEAPLTDDLVNRFKRGSQLTLTSVNFQNQQSPIQLTLQGFTGAYDGPPLNQADIEDRQKQLEEFVSRNNDEFARRLKEEQDKAKAGN